MPARTLVATATAVALAAGTAALLTGCGPSDDGRTAAGSPGSPTAPAASRAVPAGGTGGSGGTGTASPGGSGGPGGTAGGAAPAVPAAKGGTGAGGTGAGGTGAGGTGAGGTGAGGGRSGTLTVSDGTRYVRVGGARVDFGTPVRDLAWSPDGRRAAFVDGRGDLVVSAPDGSGRTVVAGNPGGQTWSHPAWRVMAADPRHGFRARNDLVFAARVEGVTGLETVPATGGTPRPLDLPLRAGEGGSGGPLPQAGNTWPSAGGRYADVAYANPSTGEVYVLDDNLRATSAPVGHGSEPAVSPAGPGGEVVFVRSVGGHDHLLVSRATENGRVTRDLTPYAATDYTEPAFSPDGRTVAARTPDGVVTLPVDGSAGPVRVSDRPGLPAYRR